MSRIRMLYVYKLRYNEILISEEENTSEIYRVIEKSASETVEKIID